jgi:hypothetical protein
MNFRGGIIFANLGARPVQGDFAPAKAAGGDTGYIAIRQEMGDRRTQAIAVDRS